jgi:hypothetical protein
MSATMSALTLQFLAWIAAAPRRYCEMMEAWWSSCPRMPAWEDAIDARFVVIDASAALAFRDASVRIPRRGERYLACGGA